MDVCTLSGYRADERPVEFVRNARRYRVIQVLEQRRAQSVSGIVSEEFRVLTDSGDEFRLVHQLGSDTWWARSVR